jgi:hypothetical protein
MSSEGEELAAAYQRLVQIELSRLEGSQYNFESPTTFLTADDVRATGAKITASDLLLKGLLVSHSQNTFRTSHVDLIFRIVNIRNLEEQRPIPLEFKIVSRPERVPDFGAHKLADVLPKILPVSNVKDVLTRILEESLSGSIAGLSSYQVPIISALLSEKYQSVAIVAPTASGKTLTFFLPVLSKSIQRCLEGKEGTSAVLAYPRVALGRDQLQTFLRFIDVANDLLSKQHAIPITLGIDDRDTHRRQHLVDRMAFRELKCVTCGGQLIVRIRRGESDIVCNRCQKSYHYILPSKDDIWDKRPTILITNIWIIYRRLMSPRVVNLFRGVDFVVTDEAHVYTHFLGGHVSYILRMLRHAAKTESKDPTFVFSSATIPNPTQFLSSLGGVDADDLYYVDFDEALSKSEAKVPQRLLLHLYLLPHPEWNIETLTEALVLSVSMWCHKLGMKAITFIDSIAEINTMRDYIHATILGRREGREVTDHVYGTSQVPTNDYCWVSLCPTGTLVNLETLKEFVLTNLKQSIQMHYGGLSLDERAAIESAFSQGLIKMLLSTSTLELGIDLSDVAIIVQHKLPLSPEGVVQRIGRAGRNPNCYRVALGIVALPQLPLSTLYMFDDALRERLENIKYLPPLRVGDASYNLVMQQVLSLALFRRALDKKSTYIDPDLDTISSEKAAVDALMTLVQELEELPEFNHAVKFLDEKTLMEVTDYLRQLFKSLVVGLEEATAKDYEKETQLMQDIQSTIDALLDTTGELKDDAWRLHNLCKPIDVFPKEMQDSIWHLSDSMRLLDTKFYELRRTVRSTLDTKNARILQRWIQEGPTSLRKISDQIPDTYQFSDVATQLSVLVSKGIGFREFEAKYKTDFNEVLRTITGIATKCGSDRSGLLKTLNELPKMLDDFATVDLNALSAYQAFKRLRSELKLVPWERLDLFEALNLMLEGNAHFSLLLETPSPDFELIGVEVA